MVLLIVFLLACYLIFIGAHGRGVAGLFMPSSLFLSIDYLLQTIFPLAVIADWPRWTHQALLILLAGYAFFFVTYFMLRFLLFEFRIPSAKAILIGDPEWIGVRMHRLRKILYFLLFLGISAIVLVFLRFGVVPALDENPGSARFFHYDPAYYSSYKFIYWAGILIVWQSIFFSVVLVDRLNKIHWALNIFGIAILVATAHRGPAFALVLALVAYYYQLFPSRASALKILVGGTVGIFAVMISLWFREGAGELIPWVIHALSVGSSFVDFYEFAVSLGLWNKELLLGETYLGTIASIIPGLCDANCELLRWKDWTKVLFDVGIEAGGYRLTTFGEAYFNFDLVGVCLKGVVLGAFFFFFDRKVKRLTRQNSSYRIKIQYLFFSAFSIVVVNFYDLRFFVVQFSLVFLVFLYAYRPWKGQPKALAQYNVMSCRTSA